MNVYEIITIIGVVLLLIFLLLNFYYYVIIRKNNTSDSSSRNFLKKWFPYLNAILGLLIFVAVGYVLAFPSEVKSLSLGNKAVWSDYSKPFEVTFTKPVNKSKISHTFSKDIRGEWKYEKAHKFDFFKTKLVFYPEESLMVDETVTFSLTYTPLLPLKKQLYTSEFSSGSGNPEIIISDDILDRQNINPNQNFSISIPDIDQYSYILDIESSPIVDLEQKKDGKTITFTPRIPFKNGEEYNITFFVTPVTYHLKTKDVITKGERGEVGTLKFQVAPSPVIKAFQPQGNSVLATESIVIDFDQSMDPESVQKSFSIEPAVEGAFDWNEDFSNVVYKPSSSLQKETKYTITIQGDAYSALGAKLIQEDVNVIQENVSQNEGTIVLANNEETKVPERFVKHSFTTIGSVGVERTIPGSGVGGVDINTNISIVFNQGVDKASAESKFSISPAVTGKFTWNGNTMIFDPSSALEYQKRYTVTLASGVKSIDGIDLKSAISFAFTTKANKVILNVQYMAQRPQFACNVTAAAMALKYKGVNIDQMTVYNYFANNGLVYNSPSYAPGVNPSAGEVWGDPNVGYVGNIYGRYGGDGTQGYGVHWNPLARAINSFKPGSAEAKTGWNTTELLREIDAKNPVIVWWQNGSSTFTRLSWKTSSGGTVNALNGMHSEVVVGYEGSPENPTYIYLLDPWNRWGGGYHKVSAAYFNNLWSNSFNRSAVVVR